MTSDGRRIEFKADLHDWWVLLRGGAVVRTWGSVARLEAGMVVFGGDTLPPLDFAELCAIPETAIDQLIKGTGLNGVPREAEPPVFMTGEDWRSALSRIGGTSLSNPDLSP